MKTDSNRPLSLLRPIAPSLSRGLALAAIALAAPAVLADGVGGGAEKPVAPATKEAAVPGTAGRDVDLAICLDTSGSMNGLIDAARQKIWSIVNDLTLAKPAPKLHVALLTYGNDGHPSEVGWVTVDVPFTEDLDRISQQLFALTTNGGTEYVGRVLQTAANLEWSRDPQALKIAIVAGNESAEQDPQVDFRTVCKQLVERGVVVDSIYCGNPADEIAPAWREVARCADGQFAAIDQQNGTVTVATPFDADLATLSASINETYLWFGKGASDACENQKAQDGNASGANSAAAASRALCKAGGAYVSRNDLVDAVKGGQVRLEEVKKEELPEKMREMTLEQKQKCLDEASGRRAEIARKIQSLAQKRDGYVQEELKRQNKDDKQSFDRAVRDAVRKQAEAKGFTFEKAKDA